MKVKFTSLLGIAMSALVVASSGCSDRSLGAGHYKRQEVVAGALWQGSMQEVTSGLAPAIKWSRTHSNSRTRWSNR